MRTARLLALLAAMLSLAVAAGDARSAATGPLGLHGFLLRADEPQKTSFSRTPSFAWNPVPGALRYEFQLSLSTSFRDNSLVYDDAKALTPVEAPPITLPWITGSPHALYARVRAFTSDGASPWSANFGFDMVPPSPPTPLAGYPGLLRWTPVEGASGYQIWLVDAHKKVEKSVSNTLDERELYTFHQNTNWTGTVRWRIRALRTDSANDGNPRVNGIPAVSYGAWSPIYTSTNPAVTGGAIKLVGTISDVFSNGSAGSPAHELMPGFLWTGNQAIDAKTTTELYRVYVFTDKQCINRVFRGAVVGAPAYSPRPSGPLALPATAAGIAAARSQYLLDGTEPPGFTYDGSAVATTESDAPSTPTTSVPTEPGLPTPTATGASSGSSPSSSTSPATDTLNAPGAPVDLWDTNWPESGYYWTVVAVAATSPDALSTSVGRVPANIGDTSVTVTSGSGFNSGDTITIGTGPTAEAATITGVNGDSLALAAALKYGHGGGETVVRTGGSLVYQDLELPQDVCAAGRVMRFGKASEPSLVSSGDLFATGLSSNGRLTSALHTTSFYGEPLVSWTPALGAQKYEVQWSRTQYPFNPVALSSGAAGVMTSSTSVVFPHELGPGTWWYRVRGFDQWLPTGAQQMSWSDPAKLVVARPQFKIVGGRPAPAKAAPKKAGAVATSGLRTVTGSGFTIGIPSNWVHKTITDSVATFVYADPRTRTNIVAIGASGRGTRTLAQWENDLKTELAGATGVTPNASLVTLPAGPAVRLSLIRTVNGTSMAQLEYVVDAGSIAYTITFTSTTARYRSDLPTFAKMIASLSVQA
jgi:hypothetical protein